MLLFTGTYFMQNTLLCAILKELMNISFMNSCWEEKLVTYGLALRAETENFFEWEQQSTAVIGH